MSDVKLPITVRIAAHRFHKDRAEYYKYLASLLSASKGNTKLSTIFDNDAQRFGKEPRGILSAYWAHEFATNGADLAEAWQGTLPNDEVTVIRVAKNAGDGAMSAAFNDIGRNAKLSDQVLSEAMKTVFMGIIALVIATGMGFIFPIFATDQLVKLFSMVPLDEWGPKAKAMLNHANRVKEYWLFMLAPVVVIGYWFKWSINNLTGPIRDKLDQHISIYRTIRDIRGTLFLATMSTLTRKRGNTSFTLNVSLTTLAQSSRSAWFKWRLYEVISRAEQSGATGSEAFDTPLISKNMYYFLRDVQEARGFSEGFQEVGTHIEETVMAQIIKSMETLRWVLLMSSVVVVAGIVGWNMSVIYEITRIVSTMGAR